MSVRRQLRMSAGDTDTERLVACSREDCDRCGGTGWRARLINGFTVRFRCWWPEKPEDNRRWFGTSLTQRLYTLWLENRDDPARFRAIVRELLHEDNLKVLLAARGREGAE